MHSAAVLVGYFPSGKPQNREKDSQTTKDRTEVLHDVVPMCLVIKEHYFALKEVDFRNKKTVTMREMIPEYMTESTNKNGKDYRYPVSAEEIRVPVEIDKVNESRFKGKWQVEDQFAFDEVVINKAKQECHR